MADVILIAGKKLTGPGESKTDSPPTPTPPRVGGGASNAHLIKPLPLAARGWGGEIPGRRAIGNSTIGLLALLLFFLAVLVPARAADDITIGTQLEPTGLDPTVVASAATGQVLFGTVYEGLVRLDESGRAQPLLARDWDISPDGLTYHFHLLDNVRFHDGTPLTAEAVKFTLERAIGPQSTNPQKTALGHIAAVTANERLTLTLRLKAPYGDLLAVLGWPAAAILAPNSAAGDASLPIGTGPFRFADWRRGDALDLVCNQDYHGRRPAIGHIRFRFIADPNAALAALKAGDIDAFDSYPAPENMPALSRDPAFQVAVGLSQGKTILALNNRQPALADLRVRQALSLAVDRDAIIKGAMFGYGQAIGSHFPPQDPDYVDMTGLYPHDAARARALLAEAGYPDGLDLSLKLPPLPYARRSGEIVAAQLAEAGVRVRLVNLEWVSWLDQVFTRHDFDMTIVAHVEPMDYDIYGRPDYYFGYDSQAFRDLLATLDRAPDAASRRTALHAIQRKIADDAVNVFLFEYPAFGVWNRRIEGLWHLTPVRTLDPAAAHVADQGGGTARSGQEAFQGLIFGLYGLGAALLLAAGFRAGPLFVIRRLAGMAGVLLAASLIIFAVLQIAPGDAARFMLGMNASPETVAALRHKLDLDGSLAERYLRWLGGLLSGRFGTSLTYGVPVGQLIGERLRLSLPLAALALGLSTILAFGTGIAAVLGRRGRLDMVISTLTQLGLAIPDFWLGLILVTIFAENLHWVTAGGFPGWQAGPIAALHALLAPAVALALPQAAILARVLRSQLLDLIGHDFVRTARAKGLSERQALLRHALPNGLVPVLTVIGMQASFLLAGAIIVENVFALPGLGRLVFQAVSQRDLIVVQGVVLVLVAGVALVNLAVDMACAAIDPRFKERS